MSENGIQPLTTPDPAVATSESESDDAATPTPASKPPVNLNMIADIPVTLSVELGRKSITIQELLSLDEGSVVELERGVEEPMQVLVNGTLVAHGEVVLIDEVIGIRLTDVVSPSERVKRIR